MVLRNRPGGSEPHESNAESSASEADLPAAPPPKARKKQGKGKAKPIPILEPDEVPPGHTTKTRSTRIPWTTKHYQPHVAYLTGRLPEFLALKGTAATGLAEEVGRDMYLQYDWKGLGCDDVKEVSNRVD